MTNANKKFDPKVPVCKASDCSDQAQVKGFCRLHFLKNLNAPKRVSAKSEREDTESLPAKRERRTRDRFLGVDQVGSADESAPNEVERMGEVNVVDLTAMIDTDDMGLPSSSSLDLDEDDFKKTG